MPFACICLVAIGRDATVKLRALLAIIPFRDVRLDLSISSTEAADKFQPHGKDFAFVWFIACQMQVIREHGCKTVSVFVRTHDCPP